METHGGQAASSKVQKRLSLWSNGTCESESEDVKALIFMGRLQQWIYRYRVRVKEFFKAFDPLNHGFVTTNQFRRALSNMGIGPGPGGRIPVTNAEFESLTNHYINDTAPKDSSGRAMVGWRKFEEEVESIIMQRGIEKRPLDRTPPASEQILKQPNPGTTNMEQVPMNIRQMAKFSVDKLRKCIEIERCHIKYFFQQFDKIHNGHTSLQQFKQVLSMLNYYFTLDEIEAMSVSYCDELGFNYWRLLNDLEPPESEQGRHTKFRNDRMHQLNRPLKAPDPRENDLDRILYEIRTQMGHRNPKLYNFLHDHDSLSHNRIKNVDFHRALDRAGFHITANEVQVLISTFKCPNNPLEFEWRSFLNKIEEVNKQLEKAPSLVPQVWKPLLQIDFEKEMNEEEETNFNKGMQCLAKKVSQRRLEFREMLRDFDKPQAGLVSVNQYHRVLHTIGLASYLSTSELQAIIKRFKVVRENREEVNYREFLKELDLMRSRQ